MKKKTVVISLLIALIIWSFLWLKVDAVNGNESTLKTILSMVKIQFDSDGYVLISEDSYLVKNKKLSDFIENYEEKSGLPFVEQIGSGYIFKDDNEMITLSSFQLTRHYLIVNE